MQMKADAAPELGNHSAWLVLPDIPSKLPTIIPVVQLKLLFKYRDIFAQHEDHGHTITCSTLESLY